MTFKMAKWNLKWHLKMEFNFVLKMPKISILNDKICCEIDPG